MPGQSARENGKKGGRPKGTTGIKWQSTIDKEVQREIVRQLVAKELEPMVKAQIGHAKGVDFLMLRQQDGTFTRATDTDQIDVAGAIGESAFRVTTQTPNVQAFTTLMAYALDKPKEQPQELNVKGTINVIDVLKQRHQRRKKAE